MTQLQKPEAEPGKPRDADIQALLQRAGQRVDPPQDMQARVYAKTLAAWQDMPAQQPAATPRSHKRVLYAGLAAAASVVLAVSLFFVGPAGAPAVGAIQVAQGSYYLNGQAQPAAAVSLPPQSQLATRDAGLTLQLAGGVVINVDVNTTLVVNARDDVLLQSGRLYLDGLQGQAWVTTPHARLLDIGTAYDVAVDPAGTRVTMREGEVQLHLPDQQQSISARQGSGEVVLVLNGHIVPQAPVATTSDYWAWRQSQRAALSLPGKTVHDYLSWAARDAGYEIDYASRAVEQQARNARFNDSSSAAQLAVQDVLQSTQFTLRTVGGYRWHVDFAP